MVLDAIDTMQRVAWHINDMKRKHEHAIRLQVSSQRYFIGVSVSCFCQAICRQHFLA